MSDAAVSAAFYERILRAGREECCQSAACLGCVAAWRGAGRKQCDVVAAVHVVGWCCDVCRCFQKCGHQISPIWVSMS